MKLYLLSIGAGVLVGILYSLLQVRSPAPPIVALLGLLGMLCGEQVIPVAKHVLAGTSLASAWHRSDCSNHILGVLPGRHNGQRPLEPPPCEPSAHGDDNPPASEERPS
ncbi:MAG: XapX domain-containing protein [Salinicola sp.]|uniref:XapX domain-containing protein n=1 Tax=Salinicola sp. TaxID=1978524 RepID=UPI001DE11CB7|nr:XapX domain-containing protein [Salinicola sp.]NRB56742.1 XapX domain-containing protein [Salinicola sp.]